MKFFLLASIVFVYVSLAVAQKETRELDTKSDNVSPKESLMSKDNPFAPFLRKCLGKLKLDGVKKLGRRQNSCVIGCILQELKMIDKNGKLLPNGFENLANNLPKEVLNNDPKLLKRLKRLKLKLIKAKSACSAGRRTKKILYPLIFG